MDRARHMLRSGDWLTRERIRIVATALLIASAAAILFLVVTANGVIDRQGRPLGTDFSNVYAAGTYVLAGNPEAPFDPPQQFAREQALFGQSTQFDGWHYPPFFLFVAAALALMPCGLALAVWQAVTLGLYLLTIGAILKAFSPENGGAIRRDPLWLLVALAFPAVLINIGHSQNGFLTAALLGGALVVLDRRPIVAGLLLGLLVYKPRYGLLIPLVLAVSGRWKCFASAAITVALLIATTLTFGYGVWHAFSPRPSSRAPSCSNKAIPAGTKSRACSLGRACGARRYRSLMPCRAR
ncbi:MAG: glycosyltransferase family 87 protein [Xanthobacteraceae bacterium]